MRQGARPGAERPPRVLLVLQSTAIGGMETHVVDLAAEYVSRGIATLVAVPEAALFDSIAARVAAAGARAARIDTDARHGRLEQVRGSVRISRMFRAFRPTVVHVHTGGATGGVGVVALARVLTGARVVVTEHDVPVQHPTFGQRFARWAMDRLSTTIVAVSRRNAAIRKARVGMHCPHSAAVLNGVPVGPVAAAERVANRNRVRAELGLAGDAPVIGCLVRLAGGKGLDDLLNAFALVRARRECSLLLVGDGPLREQLAALAGKLGVAGDVVFAGKRPQPAPYLDAMDVFALAVPAGSMSIALLEAMARGLPPVITFCGPEEAVIPGETGLGAAPRDPGSLAAALESLVRDGDLRERLGAAAAAHVRTHFSVSRVADDLLACYAAGEGGLPERLHADAPANPLPGTPGAVRASRPGRALNAS
ncbi:MAG: glycosyltransferase family 4 protein [Chloroflexi bacterium]|nr:glycosyltransferase family 4 protein [Chloroflexota bacterium]